MRFFKTKFFSKVRIGILPGNSITHWRAIHIAKDINPLKLPETFVVNNKPIPKNNTQMPLQNSLIK
jgi:hypothetical protein